jgi:hypothetical protein
MNCGPIVSRVSARSPVNLGRLRALKAFGEADYTAFSLAGINAVMAPGRLVWAIRTERSTETVSLDLIAGDVTGNVLDRIDQGAVTTGVALLITGFHWRVRSMVSVRDRLSRRRH